MLDAIRNFPEDKSWLQCQWHVNRSRERVAGKLLHFYREDIMSERRDSYQMCEYGSVRPGGAFCLHLLLTNILQVLLALYSLSIHPAIILIHIFRCTGIRLCIVLDFRLVGIRRRETKSSFVFLSGQIFQQPESEWKVTPWGPSTIVTIVVLFHDLKEFEGNIRPSPPYV